MSFIRFIKGGMRVSWPLRVGIKRPGDSVETSDLALGQCPAMRCDFFEDFDGAAVLNTKLVLTAGGAAGAAFRANIADGTYRMLLTSASGAESLLLTFGDQLNIPATARPIFRCRASNNVTLTTAQRIIFGLASATAATYDNIVTNMWFRCDLSNALTIEGDDATTDTDDQAISPAISLVNGALNRFAIGYGIDPNRPKHAIFEVNGSEAGAISLPAMTAAMVLQPFIAIQKTTGTGVPSIDVDYVGCSWDRSG